MPLLTLAAPERGGSATELLPVSSLRALADRPEQRREEIGWRIRSEAARGAHPTTPEIKARRA